MRNNYFVPGHSRRTHAIYRLHRPRNLLIKEAQAALCSFYSYEKRVVTVNHKEIRITCADSLQGSYRFAEDPELQAKLENDPMGPLVFLPLEP